MRIGILAAASVVLGLGAIAPVQADPLAYARSDNGAYWGWAMGYGSTDAAGREAFNGCGGDANGCKVVMALEGDCMAYVQSKDSSGQELGFWVGATVAENAYNRSGELAKVRDMVMGWCTSSGVPAGSCSVTHLNCLSYITNLN